MFYFADKKQNRTFCTLFLKAQIEFRLVWRPNVLLLLPESPKDLRGRHNNRPCTNCDEWTRKIKEHIEAFPGQSFTLFRQKRSLFRCIFRCKKIHSDEKYPELENLVNTNFI